MRQAHANNSFAQQGTAVLLCSLHGRHSTAYTWLLFSHTLHSLSTCRCMLVRTRHQPHT